MINNTNPSGIFYSNKTIPYGEDSLLSHTSNHSLPHKPIQPKEVETVKDNFFLNPIGYDYDFPKGIRSYRWDYYDYPKWTTSSI